MHCWGSGNLGRCHLLERTFDPPRVRFPDNAAVFFFFNFWRTESVAGGQSGNNRNNTGMNRRAHCRRNKNGRNILMCYNFQASLLLRLATLLNFGSRRHRCRQSGAIQVMMLPLDSEAALGDLGTTAL